MTNIPFNRPTVLGRELDNIIKAVETGQLSGDGAFTKKCNDLISGMAGSRKALLTHSCTAALEMAAILCDLAPGDEVIMPSYTFVSTANAVALRGATPVFVDIDPKTLNIDPDAVEKAVGKQTKAIFAVHYAGFPADMDRLNEIGRAHGLWVVEDAAQALGSTYKGRAAGSLGDMATFSFHETKNITSGEGGALTINRDDLIERAEIIREKGTNRANFMQGLVDKYTWVDIGSSYLPGELVAAFLHAQLENAERVRLERRKFFDSYMKAFEPMAANGKCELPRVPPDTVGNGHMFYLLMNTRSARDAFIRGMKERGINAPFHYVPLHTSPYGAKHCRTDNTLANTDDISSRLVRLPMFFSLGGSVTKVIDAAYRCVDGNTA